MHGLDLTFDIKTNSDDDNHGKCLSVFYAKKGQGVHFVSCERSIRDLRILFKAYVSIVDWRHSTYCETNKNFMRFHLTSTLFYNVVGNHVWNSCSFRIRMWESFFLPVFALVSLLERCYILISLSSLTLSPSLNFQSARCLKFFL